MTSSTTTSLVSTRPRRRWRAASVAMFAVVGLLVLAGCMKIDMDFTLSEEDTVSGSIVMAFSDEFAESLGMDPQELWDSANEGEDSMTEELPEGATEEPYADGEYTGTRITYSDQPLASLSDDTGDFSITREGDEYVVDGVMDFSDNGAATGGQGEEMPAELMDTFEVRIAVTFPGEVIETNGEVEGTTTVWTPVMGETTEISARGSAVAGGAAAEDPAEESTDGEADTDEGTDENAAGSDTAEDTSGEDSGAIAGWIIAVAVLVGLAVLGLIIWLIVRNNRPSGPTSSNPQDVFGAPGDPAAPPPYTAGGAPQGYGQPQQPAPPVVPPQHPVPPQQGPADASQPPSDPDATPPAPR